MHTIKTLPLLFTHHIISTTRGEEWKEKRERENPFPSSPLLFRRLPRGPTAKTLPLLFNNLTQHMNNERGGGGEGKGRNAEGKIPFLPLPSSFDACHVGSQLGTYHSISTTGRESLCSLLCALRRNIRYSSGEAPGIVDTVLVNKANSVSSGR